MSTDLVPVDTKNVDKLLNSIPDIPLWVCRSIYDIGLALLRDDAHDIGYFQYYNRQGAYYHGRKTMNHNSPIHHWQPAIIMIILSQVLGLLTKTKEIYADFVEADKLYEDEDKDDEKIDESKIISVNYKVLEDKGKLTDKIPTVYY